MLCRSCVPLHLKHSIFEKVQKPNHKLLIGMKHLILETSLNYDLFCITIYIIPCILTYIMHKIKLQLMKYHIYLLAYIIICNDLDDDLFNGLHNKNFQNYFQKVKMCCISAVWSLGTVFSLPNNTLDGPFVGILLAFCAILIFKMMRGAKHDVNFLYPREF